jgi:hypothetical protein
LKIKAYITKKVLIRLVVFTALIGAALVLDTYFEKNPADLDNIQAGAEQHNPKQGEVYFLAQASPSTVKTSVQKTFARDQRIEKHTKFLRKYHSIRNYQVLKAERIQQTTPLITSYHYLVFQTHLFTPDEDPLS